ncbi:MAG: tetratricopeptide repeat protein [Gammaproteobacteria bacterium]|jgi:tetratricopeptide (TPR) repeat protein
MLNDGPPLIFVKLLSLAVILAIAAVGIAFAEELPIDEVQTQAIMEKAEVLETEIQRRQQEVALQPQESKEYQTGFEDGYNKAILDLLKSKLLNDPTLSPKPKGAGLYATTARQSPQRSAPQYREDASPAAAFSSPALTIAVPATAVVSIMPMENSSNSVTTVEPEAPSTSINTAATTVVTTVPADQATPQQQQITAQDWLQKSNAYLGAKNWQQAIDAATQAIALDNNLVDSYVVRSWAHAENGQSQQALEDVAAAIQLDPQNALAYNNRAYVHELLNNTENAQQDYQQACTLGYQPACETVVKLKQVIEQQRQAAMQATIKELTDKSYQQFQQQDWQGVVATATELLELDPENTVALVNRAGAYAELSNYQQALDDCNTALIVDPNMGVAYNNKGYVLELMGELKKAVMEYETACVLGVQQSCGDFKRLSQKVSALN